MPECPSCHKDVTHNVLDNWFPCPICNRWLRLRTNEHGSNWLERGEFRDGHIHPVHNPRIVVQDNPAESEGSTRTLQSVAARPASSSNAGLQFGCSMFVAGLAIFIFTRMINLSLDSHAWLVLFGTAFGAGVAMFIVSQID